MEKSKFLIPGMAVIALVPFVNPSYAQKEKARPNIIYILADDLGYGDIGCYGQKYIKTPNIDRMATEGIRFTQHYTGAPVCAPARCCLMTGKSSMHAYVRDNFEVKGPTEFEHGQTPIPESTATLPKIMKQAGYVTALIGKWGLGSMASSGSPNKQGFDFFFGYNDQNHAHNHYPYYVWRNDKQEFLEGNVLSVHPKIDKSQPVSNDEYKKYMGLHYSADMELDEAVKFIGENKKKPFFLYLAFEVPHKALQVPDESLEMYNGVFDEKPYDGKAGYTPHPRPLSAYAAMITRMDSKIGIILQKLKELGIDDNTIVMFSSDNGPAGGGGLDSQFFNSSGGLHGHKAQVWDGGIREPFVVRWPGKIIPGKTTDLISAQYDLMATLADITSQKLTNTDGISFLSTLLGQTKKQKLHEYLYWEFSSGGGQIAIRMDDWKGVRMSVSGNANSKWEVFNMKDDVKETKDLSAEHPDLIKKFDDIVKQRTPSQNPNWNFMDANFKFQGKNNTDESNN